MCDDMNTSFDVIVIGGGHAGCEAAAAAARLGADVALITMDKSRIGEMSCNPAIGGLGKGHLVREIDALDGIMGQAIDRSGIQFRMLNKSRGPAVHGPRAQADRQLYRYAVQDILCEYKTVEIIQASVNEIVISNHKGVDQVSGVITDDSINFRCSTVVLTTGTFLGGMIHIGSESIPAGRIGEAPSNRLASFLKSLTLPIGRLKTGTPPRLDGDTINWHKLEMQPADESPIPFSSLTDFIKVPQIKCGITRTTEKTHDIIRESIHLSSINNGLISGNGPRYCPSIEDKVSRFPEKESHQIFLEPEGLNDRTVYPNGISTSLPKDVQRSVVSSIPGLESAKIIQYGYAIEYDFVDPRSLRRSLSLRALEGLYLAGQINGTTGYEEAGAQGLMAGINAALHARNGPNFEPFILNRADAYIGVMIDDLVVKGAPEPYRMFTSRAEYRLLLRSDNADLRLTEKGQSIGCISRRRQQVWTQKLNQIQIARKLLNECRVGASVISKAGLPAPRDGSARSASDLLALEGIGIKDLLKIWPKLAEIPTSIHLQLEADCLYSGYLGRQQSDIDALRRDESVAIPNHVIFDLIGGLSSESKDILNRFRPETIGQANRLPGLTPAAVMAVLNYIKHKEKQKAKVALF